MNRATFLYVGALLTVIASFLGLVTIPQVQLRGLGPVVDAQGNPHPAAPEGAVAEGRVLYKGYGCMYCHSQQVRPEGFGADIERGWGMRRTVARDHIWDAPPLLGTMRTGPDLANIAQRQPSKNWHYLHLFDPTLTSPGSTMPQFPFLFRVVELAGERPYEAVDFPPDTGHDGEVLVPTHEGEVLFAYLMSLDASYAVPEVK